MCSKAVPYFDKYIVLTHNGNISKCIYLSKDGSVKTYSTSFGSANGFGRYLTLATSYKLLLSVLYLIVRGIISIDESSVKV